MSSATPTPSNRRERRAQARNKAPKHADNIPLSHPSRGPPKSKTLLDLAAERDLIPSSTGPSDVVETSLGRTPARNDRSSQQPTEIVESEATPILDIALYTLSLTLLHLTLTILVENQYAVSPPTLHTLPAKIWSTTIASPQSYVLLALVSALHPRASQRETQALFTLLSLGCGAALVHVTNRDAYLAAMQRAPSLGTLWVWSAVELRWELAAGTAAGVAVWAWCMGYGF